MTLRGAALALLVVAGVTAALPQSDSVTARAWVDSVNFRIGDPIALHIVVVHPRRAILQPPAGDSLGSFVVLERLPVTPLGDTAASTGLVVAYYDSGTAVIPPAYLPYAFPGDTAGRMARTNPVTVTVHTMAVDTSKEYRDLKSPLSIPISLAELLLYAAIAAVVLALLYAGYRLWKKRKQGPAPDAPPVPERPAHLLAIEELAALQEQKLWQRGLIKEYYTGVTEIIRRYFERRYSVRALEETTGEILEALRGAGVVRSTLDVTARMLRLADLVKFAKFEPGITEHREVVDLARAIVEQTKPAEAPPVVPAVVETSAHVEPNITLASPAFLYGLIAIPLLVYWYIRRNRDQTADLRYSTLAPFAGVKPTLRERMRHLPFVFRMVVVALILVALARPQTTSSGENIYTEGIDIALLLDISGSMLAEDFSPNRIEAAKAVAQDFVDGRAHDRIGLVIFAGQSFTQCPMTLDYRVLKGLLRQVRPGMVEDGTAIGMAIAQGVNRLKDSKARSRVMILLTDGVNNRGEIDPLTASQIAQSFGIRIYTIGVGTIGEAPYPVQTPFGVRYQNMPVDVDEKTLQQIASMTGGEYFRATNNRALKEIYSQIDAMEKTRIEVRAYRSYTELFYPWAGLGVLLLLVEFTLRGTVLRKLP